MQYQATLSYSKPLVRQAVFVFWRRTVGIGFPVAFAVLGAGLAVLLMQGDISWVVGALATVFAVTIAFLLAIYAAPVRNAMRKLKNMDSSHLAFIAEEPSFAVTSRIASSTPAWTAVIEVWRFPTFWILLFSKAHFFTLPLAGVSPEMQVFVLQRIQASGGKLGGAT
jgi:hypothetical protein